MSPLCFPVGTCEAILSTLGRGIFREQQNNEDTQIALETWLFMTCVCVRARARARVCIGVLRSNILC